ncbi:MAG TPA: ATP-binding protein [Planctomycetota bacterium]|nr:ATP-binding protein [Planctomycetota bacterium]
MLEEPEGGERRERRARKARRRRAFGIGILTTFAVVLGVATVTIFVIAGTSIHLLTKTALEDELARRLETTASLAARQLEEEPQLLQALLANSGKQARAFASDIARKVRDASNVHEIVVFDRTWAIKATASGADDAASTLAQIAADKATIDEAISKQKAVSTPLFPFRTEPTGPWRHYKIAYAPLQFPQPGDLIVGVDCPADFTESVERVDRRFTLLGLGSIAAVLACAVFLVRQRVHIPIYRLVRAMEGGDPESADPGEPGRPQRARVRWRDEIGALTDHYNQMVDRLNAQEGELRELAQQAQRRAEFLSGYSKYLVEGVPSAVVAVDAQRNVTVWNEGAQRLLGAGEIGKPLAVSLDGHPVRRALERALAGELSDEALVAIGPAGDAEVGEGDQEEGGARLVELAAAPLKDPKSGEILGAAALVHDRTELERLRRAAARNERLAAIGRLAAGLAHEIRNPLGAISGFAELIERKRGGDDAPRLAQRLRGEVAELNRFLTEFLAFARDARIKREACDLNEVVRRAAETALQATGLSVDDTRRALEGAALAREGGELRVVLEGEKELQGAVIDAAALKAAVVNIAKNAVEAMKGRGTLSIRSKRANDVAVIRVRDTGPGVPAELREKIFDPFFTTRDNGVGLGLAIAHKLVAAHGGKIAVRAPDEGGCEFVIRVPVTGTGSAGPPAVEDDATPMQGGTRPQLEEKTPSGSGIASAG